MTDPINDGGVMAIAALAAQGLVEGIESGAVVMAPKDWTPHSLEEFQVNPNRIKVQNDFGDVRSLVAYLKRYSLPGNLFVTSDPSKGEISAILDYHNPSTTIKSTPASPKWCAHRAAFTARRAPQYQAWRGLHRKALNQTDAGEFLEDRAEDVVEPMGAYIMEMIMKFEALKKVSFASSMRLRDGQVQLTYQEESEGKGGLTIPDTLMLLVPVFEGMEPERIKVRLRFRINEGKLTFIFVIANIEELERLAFGRCEHAFITDMTPGTNLVRR